MIVDQVKQALIDAGITETIYTHHSTAIDDSHILVILASGGMRKPGDLKNYAQDLIRVQATLNDSTAEQMLALSASIKNALIKYYVGNNIFMSQLNSESELVPIRRGNDWQWFGVFEVTGCDA